ncbi:uncharacterized protein LOC125775357 isoform X1 [Bactrocera dorsalis]|uniref:Uncharacterized protein LOC125775357 isoform X1 n=1 Tax=Bactrocera dorsalis TaxID=27457 RepID=A0ABM3IXU7_BACDO|nr:uncharacterized protein LOC125775357 isoform X1 [Bactrocera dorsalis]
MKFYAYRMMIRQNYDNHLLRYRRLVQQYAVDMYVKVETERLNYMRYTQSKLRSEEYIHLRDAMNGDADITDIGRLYILPSTYIGSPRHMHEYSQDAMTYMLNYGRPDLFLTFTCNPKWPDITNLLHNGQSPSDRHEVTARVFKQKLRCLMDFITKQRVYSTVRCWMYSWFFSKELLRIGNGQVPIDPCSGLISIPTTICQFTSNKYELISSVYPNIAQNYGNYDWLSTRAILAAKNTDVNDLNWTIQNKIPGDLRSYTSIDRVENEDEVVNYPVEFLNSLMPPEVPPHNLRLKVRSVAIMLRNLHAPKLCNGTRLIVTKLMDNLIVASILKGPFKGEECLLPRIPLTSTDLPFQFRRLQFPVKLAFAMTINTSQGQSLEVCGISLEMSCFSLGQLYVACSRVGKPSSLFIYAADQKTKNIVYRAALN